MQYLQQRLSLNFLISPLLNLLIFLFLLLIFANIPLTQIYQFSFHPSQFSPLPSSTSYPIQYSPSPSQNSLLFSSFTSPPQPPCSSSPPITPIPQPCLFLFQSFIFSSPHVILVHFANDLLSQYIPFGFIPSLSSKMFSSLLSFLHKSQNPSKIHLLMLWLGGICYFPPSVVFPSQIIRKPGINVLSKRETLITSFFCLCVPIPSRILKYFKRTMG